MNLIIPLADVQLKGAIELKYMLRSVEQYITGIDEVYIISKSLPKWVKNVNHITVRDIQRHGYIQYNIYNKISKVYLDNFLLMSDDYYLTKSIDANHIPYYHKGELFDSINKRDKNESYTISLINTYKLLKELNCTTKDCDLHYPVIINKQKLLSIIPDRWPLHGYSLRSLYSNLNNIETTFMEDNKIKRAKEFTPEMKFFSTTDTQVDKEMRALFERLYPSRSKYEK